MRYLLDTDTVIDAIRRRNRVASRMREISPDDLAVSAMTVSELHYGAMRSAYSEQRLRDTAQLLRQVAVLPFARRTALVHARLRVALRHQPIGPNDLIVAATALSVSATLITSNTDEFSRVPGLRIESWR